MLDTILFDGWKSVLRIAIMSLLAYPFLILLLRSSGKRSLTNVNIFDFIITVTYGATLGSIITSDKVSFADGAVVLFMLTLLQYIVSKLSVNSKGFTQMIKASPSFIYRNGEFDEKSIQKHRIRKDDLRGKVRQQGLSSFEQVEAIVLEGDGSLSIIKKQEGLSKDALENVK
ncbi:DUF421 domain-containing protein [Planococcus maitriensis]|uniref:DUF421 domain-containing protein n=1 Tax=Planococcus maitriensis TaxID=221799 RepID=A0A365K6Y8_9BACL|nr:YetF domain-containing protein [Planococcus maitriensis]RAZ68406.1 DUF421 domain-containing protein [Planococcus maitriensis]